MNNYLTVIGLICLCLWGMITSISLGLPQSWCTTLDRMTFHLMSDPIQALGEVYAWLGLDFTPEIERAMRDYLEAKPRGKHGSHDYGFADLGLDLATERARFADYQARFDVPSEVV